jgi:hypothetical protein
VAPAKGPKQACQFKSVPVRNTAEIAGNASAGTLEKPGRQPSIELLTTASSYRSGEMNDKEAIATCDDCYFRCAGLCALKLETPCPTFRHHTSGELAKIQPLRLTPRPLGDVVKQALTASVAAA